MTLSRQLIATISALVLVTMIGVQAIHLRSAHQQFQNQLESLAQDTSTSLSLSLGTLLREGDRALAETVINPVFDRGHYQLIEFISPTGEVLVRKTLPSTAVGKYPSWFVRLFSLDAPIAESFVSAGWRQLGKLRVRAHPRFAYEQLWQTASETALYLLAIYAAGLIALRLILLRVLRPLAAIEQAAIAISERNFVTIDAMPATLELARVVGAMNALSRKVGDAITAESARATALQREAYEDEVSGLLNRRGLTDQFEDIYGEELERFVGTLAIVGISRLGEVNSELGEQRCDSLLRGIGGDIATVVEENGGFAARWAGAQFLLVLPGLRSEAGRRLLDRLQARIMLTLAETGLSSVPSVRVGAVSGPSGNIGFEALVSIAQEMLDQAARLSPLGIQMREIVAGTLAGVRSRASLEHFVLDDFKVVLVSQDALALPGREFMHTEIMARIPDATGTLVAASQFMEILSREGLMRRLDEAVVESVNRALPELSKARRLSINLSARSLDENDFIGWLAGRIERMRLAPGLLVFEMSEHGVVQNENAVERLAVALRQAGAGFAIDHFGVHRNSIALLPRFKPAYLKLAGLHTANVCSDAGTRFLVEAIIRAARQLDVPVIAQSVESETQLAALAALGVAGFQGYLGGTPAPWPRSAADPEGRRPGA